jgi:hypothetical protein
MNRQFLFCSIVFSLFLTQGVYAQSCISSASAPNLITNGDFEGTANASYSAYTYVPSGANGPGTWGISQPVSSGTSYVPATWKGMPADASGNSSGHYMLIDANATVLAAWQSQSITVTAGTTYFFSAWIANINKNYTNPTKLQFAINGTIISATAILADSSDHNWSQYYTSWVAPANETITLSLINENGTGTGNDMGLDNITFSSSCKFVVQLNTSELPSFYYDCNGSAVTLDSEVPSAGTTFNWTRNGTTVASATGPSLTTGSASLALGTYVLCYTTTSNNCSQSDTVQVVNAPIVITIDTVSPTTCGGSGMLEIEGLAPGSVYTVIYTKGSLITLNGQVPDSTGNINIAGTAGTYAGIQVSNAYGCSSNIVSTSLVDPVPMSINFNGTAYPAKSSCTASWNVKIYGVLDNTYQEVNINGKDSLIQSNSSTTPYIQLSNLSAGTYLFTVTDTNTDCTSNALPLVLKNEDQPTISVTGTPPSCPPTNNAVITISGDTLLPNHNYNINYFLNGTSMTKVSVTSTNTSPAQIIWTEDHSGVGLTGGAYTNITAGPSTSCASNALAITLSTCPLPVELTDFYGNTVNNINKLFWSTASEQNNAYFIIERSNNGIDFDSIGFVRVQNNSINAQNYYFNEIAPLYSTVYYRLKQVDFSGYYNYSTMIAIVNSQADIGIYPNPSNGEFKINTTDLISFYTLDIIDLKGTVVYSIDGYSADGLITVKASFLAQGIYFLRLYADNAPATIMKLIIY